MRILVMSIVVTVLFAAGAGAAAEAKPETARVATNKDLINGENARFIQTP